MSAKDLRKLYAAALRSGLHGADIAKIDVSPDEWVHFAQLHYPLMTKRAALLASQRPDIRRVGAAMPRDEAASPTADRSQETIERKASVDLVTAKVDPKCQELTLDRVKNVTGVAALKRLRALEALWLIVCDSTDEVAKKPMVQLTELHLESVTPRCLRAALSHVSASDIDIGGFESTVNLRNVLRFQRKVRVLGVAAPLVRGVAALREHPLEELALSEVTVDDEWRDTFKALAPRLRRLVISSSESFGPDDVGSISRAKALRQIRVPVFRDREDEWLDFAAAHDKIGFVFDVAPEPNAKKETITLAELHRGVDILRCAKGKKVQFEVADDLASRRRSYKGDNGDLEDEVRAAARGVKREVQWGSESDTFVARVADLETARWVIDTALGVGDARE